LILVGRHVHAATWVAADLARGNGFASPDTASTKLRSGRGAWLLAGHHPANRHRIGDPNAVAAQAAVSRILFAMARDGKLPAILAKVLPLSRLPT